MLADPGSQARGAPFPPGASDHHGRPRPAEAGAGGSAPGRPNRHRPGAAPPGYAKKGELSPGQKRLAVGGVAGKAARFPPGAAADSHNPAGKADDPGVTSGTIPGSVSPIAARH